jgi:hypothetical protein
LMAPPIFMNHATSPAFKVGSNPLIVRTIWINFEIQFHSIKRA